MTTTINELETFAKTLNDLIDADRTIVTVPLYIKAIADELQVSAYPQTYFIADRAYEVTSLREVHDTLQASADGASIMISKVTGTTVPSSATLHLITDTAFSGTDNVYKGFNLKGIAVNTVTNATLTNQVSSLTLAAGDRLVWGANGTLNSTFVSLTTVLKKI